MNRPSAKQIATLEASGQFDSEWYVSAYPDVSRLDISPAVHYLRYGHLLDRDPSPRFSTFFARTALGVKYDAEPISWLASFQDTTKPAPTLKPDKILAAANQLILNGSHELALNLADKFIPRCFHHGVQVLHANYAATYHDYQRWIKHLNQFFNPYGAPALSSNGAGALFDSIFCPLHDKRDSGPLISVIMPAKNAAKTIVRAAQSILNQTWKNLELLIIDDCSNDETLVLVKSLAEADCRVKILSNPISVGPYVSKNKALSCAEGEFVTGHDADDWAFPNRLELHYRHALTHSAPASLSYMLRMSSSGSVDNFTPVGAYSLDGVLRLAPISLFVNREWMLASVGYWDSVRFGADSEMIARIQKIIGGPLPVIKKVGMICLESPDGLTNHPVHGIRADKGKLSKVRSLYKTAWSVWHSTCEREGELRLKFPPDAPPYDIPPQMHVACDEIQQVIRSSSFR